MGQISQTLYCTPLAAVALSGKILQGTTEIPFLDNNLASIAGGGTLAFITYAGCRMIGFNAQTATLAGSVVAAAIVIVKELALDPASYGHGIDNVDLYGGLASIIGFVFATTLQLRKGRIPNLTFNQPLMDFSQR